MAKLELDNLPVIPNQEGPNLAELVGLGTEEDPPGEAGDTLDRETVRAVLEDRSDEYLLNPSLDREQLAETYERVGVVRVADVFRPEVAEYFYREFQEKIPWSLRYHADGEHKKIPPEEWEGYTDQERRALYDRVGRGAKERYQAFFHRYTLDPDDGEHLIDLLPYYLQREEFQGLVESISGIRFDDLDTGWATRMSPGHFLRMHREKLWDGFSSSLQFTKNWKPDWGGILSFADQDGNIFESLVPQFNSFIMFKIPVIHSVSPVAPYATEPRYIISFPGTGSSS